MSIRNIYEVKCDRCPDYEGGLLGRTVEDAERSADNCGFTSDGERHYCPDHQDPPTYGTCPHGRALNEWCPPCALGVGAYEYADVRFTDSRRPGEAITARRNDEGWEFDITQD